MPLHGKSLAASQLSGSALQLCGADAHALGGQKWCHGTWEAPFMVDIMPGLLMRS
jgi:hypothetical protein